jgi:hypothetical protein
MATSVYFNNQKATSEQFLIEDLIIESIKNHGIDVYYLPRASQSSTDELFGDDPVKTFNDAIKIEVYMESFQDFEGNQEFFSKFGLEIQKSAKLAVARRSFNRYVTPISGEVVPKEGDLIWLPVQQKLMEIKFVEEEKNFFQAGKVQPYMFGLSIEAFKYNGELFNTGTTEIDDLGNKTAFNVEYSLTAGGTGTFTLNEKVFQGANVSVATAFGYVSSWDKVTRKLKIRNAKGIFANNTTITGASSNASWTLVSGNVQEDSSNDYDDNVRIETEGDNFLDFTETNPFGEP